MLPDINTNNALLQNNTTCREQYTTANELACDADSILHDTDSECGDEICVEDEESGAEDSVSFHIVVYYNNHILETDKFWPNYQTKTIQYKVTMNF